MSERGSHHQRRPPDVEEALSSMLWTPYERTPTDSSSEDDDERLSKKLCNSHSSSDCRTGSANNFVSPNSLHFGDPALLQLTMTTATTTAAVGDATQQPTPFVPFSNVFYNDNTDSDICADTTTNYYKNYDSSVSHFRFSYPYCGPLPNLNRWWSSATSTKKPPSYESLYRNASTQSKGPVKPVFDVLKAAVSTVSSSAGQQLQGNTQPHESVVESASINGRMVHSFTDDFVTEDAATASSIDCEDSQQSSSQHVAGNVEDTPPNAGSHCNINDIIETIDEKRYTMTSKDEHAKEESQQSRESNQNCTRNSCSQLQTQQQILQLHATSDAVAKGIDEDMAREQEIRASRATIATTMSAEQVNQPVSSIGQRFVSPVNVRTANVNIETAATTPQRLDQRMNTAAMNTIANLFTLVRDKTTITIAARDSNSNSSSNRNSNSHKTTNSKVLVHSLKYSEPAIIQSTTSSLDGCTAAGYASPTPSQSASSSSSYLHSRLNLWRKGRLKEPRTYLESSQPVSVAVVPAAAHSTPFASSNANSIGALTPNKCLAELERLYAEFRASESALAVARVTSSSCDCRSGDADESVSNMRVNIPATSIDSNAETVSTRSENHSRKGVPTTTSSVFLTGTNSVATNCHVSDDNDHLNNNNCNDNNSSNNEASNGVVSNKRDSNGNSVAVLAPDSGQCQPSLTIKVNDIDNVDSSTTALAAGSKFNVVLHQPVVNNNGVSVINCNYSSIPTVGKSGYCTDKSVPKNTDINDNQVVDRTVISNPNVNSSNYTVPNVLFSNNGDDVARNNKNESDTAVVVTDSSVNIIRVSDQSKSACSTSSAQVKSQDKNANSSVVTAARTFTSTECQTDDISSVQLRADRTSASNPSNREQRRRERRERRHQQLQNQPSSNSLLLHHRRVQERHSMPVAPPLTHLHAQHMQLSVPSTATMPAAMSAMLRPMLPDLLHSHFPPPYTTLPLSGGACASGGPLPHPPPLVGPPPIPPRPATTLVTSVITTAPMPGGPPVVSDGRFTLPLPIIRRAPSERSGKGCCGQWFAGPPLRALIAVVALGGVACALAGAALGATGLAGPPSSHLTAALLMIGVGVVLVTVSGAAWRMTAPGGPPCLGLGSGVDLSRCGRRPCGRSNGTPHGLLYPEFQHRPPPPSYQASMQEYRLRLLLLDRDRQSGVVRGNSPPPTYRSHVGSLLRAPLTTTIRGGSSSIGGTSECSLPPSYRSRNITTATMSSIRSIETAPSGRLLANEDIPEPVCIEQLPDYSSLQPQRSSERQASASALPNAAGEATKSTSRTSTSQPEMPLGTFATESETPQIVNICWSDDGSDLLCVKKEKLDAQDFVSKADNTTNIAVRSTVMNANVNNELITIVTISEGQSDKDNESCSGKSAGEQIEILGHL